MNWSEISTVLACWRCTLHAQGAVVSPWKLLCRRFFPVLSPAPTWALHGPSSFRVVLLLRCGVLHGWQSGGLLPRRPATGSPVTGALPPPPPPPHPSPPQTWALVIFSSLLTTSVVFRPFWRATGVADGLSCALWWDRARRVHGLTENTQIFSHKCKQSRR